LFSSQFVQIKNIKIAYITTNKNTDSIINIDTNKYVSYSSYFNYLSCPNCSNGVVYIKSNLIIIQDNVFEFNEALNAGGLMIGDSKIY
jgi:hypothetical protein